MMKMLILLVSLTLMPPPLWAANNSNQHQQPPIDFFEVPELPVAVTAAKLRSASRADALKFSITNRSSERLMGLRFILLVVSPGGKLRSRTGWMQHIALEINAVAEYTSAIPAQAPIKSGDRVVLAVEQVISRESIWKVINAKEAFTAYAMNAQPVAPDVRRVSNNVDAVPGMKMPVMLR